MSIFILIGGSCTWLFFKLNWEALTIEVPLQTSAWGDSDGTKKEKKKKSQPFYEAPQAIQRKSKLEDWRPRVYIIKVLP